MFKIFALAVAGALWGAWLVLALREKGVNPIREVLDRFSRLKWICKVGVLFIVVQLTMFGGAKHGTNDVGQTDGPTTNDVGQVGGDAPGDGTNDVGGVEGGLPDDGGPTNAPPLLMMGSPLASGEGDVSPLVSRITETDYENGYVLHRVVTNDVCDFSAPDDAVVATNWLKRGAADDYRRIDLADMHFPFRELLVTNLVVFADATVHFGEGAEFPSAVAPLGIVPEANWSFLDAARRPSCFWWRKVGHDRCILTWQNALRNRALTNSVSYQVELNRNGNIVTRIENVERFYHRLVELDRTNPDRDGDGLTTEEEIFDYGTDPGLADTDGDGVPDGEEMRLHTNAFVRDTDGDGYADATDPHPNSADSHEDADGDGLPDDWKNGWFGEGAVVSLTDDPGQDGINNLNALLMGVNPLASGTNGFVETASAKPVNLNAWVIAPSAFSFEAPTGTETLVVRTFAVERTSPWQHLLVSSCPNQAEGWESADIAIAWHSGDLSGVVPASASDSWRIPIEPDVVAETMTFEIVATGPHPSLSRPLYLLRWTPHLEFWNSGTVSIFHQDRLRVAVRPDPETGAYGLPFTMSTDYPHRGGLDVEVVQALGLPPVSGLRMEGRAFTVSSPEAFDLPSEGTQVQSRLIFYRMIIDNSCEVSSGPRASQYATPYPLDTRAARRSYQEAATVPADETISVTLLPDIPDLGYTNLTPQVRAPRLLLGAAAGPSLKPPADVGPTVGGDPCTNDTNHVESGPDGHDPEPDPDDPDPGCGCNRDGTSLGSFRIRISLGEIGKDEMSGYLWTVVTGETAIAASVFNILGTEGVSAVTNDAGDVTITCSDNGGRTIVVSNVLNGVDIPVRLASGELDSIWQIRNPGGDLSTIRAIRLTHLFNATSDETYAIRRDDDGNVLWEQTDNIRGVRRVRRETVDPANPAFVREEFEQTYLADRLVREETRTYECVGDGTFGVRRLSEVGGYDEKGWQSESRTYWCDAQNRYRHGKLRSVRSNRQAWAYHDYDSAGRETVRIEQLDGSPFPSLSDVSLTGDLPTGTSAKITVMDYATAANDDADRNDSEWPRLTETYVRQNGGEPILIARTERTCTRQFDMRHLPLRCTVTTEGFGAAVRTTERREYPDDSVVPTYLRGLEVYSEEQDGTVTETSYALSNGCLIATARTSFGGIYQKTYTVTTYETAFCQPLRVETRLTENDVVIDWTENAYDDRQRLRSTTYSDGTVETNVYSCCRLLWKRDREGRKTLRSARTGMDSLYYAEEDVWYGSVSEGGDHRVVQHFFDGFGRETNTVTYSSWNEGVAADPVVPGDWQMPSVRTTEYMDDWWSGESYMTDERGAVIDSWEYSSEESTEHHAQTYADDRWFGESETIYRGGRTETYKSWDDKWARQIRATSYSADGNRRETVTTESSDYATVTNSVMVFDPLGRVISQVSPQGTTTLAYDGGTSRVLSETFVSGDVTRLRTYVYDDGGEQVGETVDGVMSRSDVSYEQLSNDWWKVTRETVAGPETNALTTTYEQLTGLGGGLLARTVRDVRGGEKTTSTVNFNISWGLRTEVTTSSVAASVTSRSYYGIETSREADGETVYTWHDGFGYPVYSEREDATTWYPVSYKSYNEVGDLTDLTLYTNYWECVTESYEYDQLGNRVSVANANGDETVSSYDAHGNLISEDGATYPVRYAYDTQDRRVAMWTNRSGDEWDETRWMYDPATGLRTQKRRADGTTVGYTYTPDGLLETTVRSNGHWTRNVYNAARQLVGVETDEGYEDSIVRDVYGRETAAQNASATYAYWLDDGGIATNESVMIGSEAAVIRREVDDNGRIASIETDKDGQVGFVGYSYRPDGRLGTVTNGEVSVTYACSDDGRDAGSSLSVAGGATFVRTVTRDTFRRELVTSVENSIGADYAYGYDALGQPIQRNGDAFAYDARNQVISESYSLIPVDEGYSYDNIGNATFAALGTVTNSYTANAVNEYASILSDGSEVVTAYDAEGNQMAFGDWSYGFDAQNRLTSVSSNGILVATNFYDYKGRRVRMVTQDAAYTFVYDGWNIVLELIERNGQTERVECYWGKDVSGTLQEAGGIGGLLYLKRNGTIYVPIYDAYGNVVEYRAADGSLVASYAYDAFGRTIAQSGSLADIFRHRHATKCYEPETGLYYYGYRHYSPTLFRWLTPDPIEEDGGLNLYGFCGNNGLCLSDALGKSFGDWVMCTGECVDSFRIDWVQLLADLELLRLSPYNYITKTTSEAKALGGSTGRNVFKNPKAWTTIYSRNLDRLIKGLKAKGTAEALKAANSLRATYGEPAKVMAKALNFGRVGLLTWLTALEGYYNWAVMIYCGYQCCGE